MKTLSSVIFRLQREFGKQPPGKQEMMDEIIVTLQGMNREQSPHPPSPVREVRNETPSVEVVPQRLPELRIMQTTEQQIDFIIDKSRISRGAGKLALMSVLLGLQDEIFKPNGS